MRGRRPILIAVQRDRSARAAPCNLHPRLWFQAASQRHRTSVLSTLFLAPASSTRSVSHTNRPLNRAIPFVDARHWSEESIVACIGSTQRRSETSRWQSLAGALAAKRASRVVRATFGLPDQTKPPSALIIGSGKFVDFGGEQAALASWWSSFLFHTPGQAAAAASPPPHPANQLQISTAASSSASVWVGHFQGCRKARALINFRATGLARATGAAKPTGPMIALRNRLPCAPALRHCDSAAFLQRPRARHGGTKQTGHSTGVMRPDCCGANSSGRSCATRTPIKRARRVH